MATLKDKLSQYEKMPDESLWPGIAKSLKRRAMSRRAAVAAGVVAAAASLALVMLTDRNEPVTEASADVKTVVEQVYAQPADEVIDGSFASNDAMESVPASAAADSQAKTTEKTGEILAQQVEDNNTAPTPELPAAKPEEKQPEASVAMNQPGMAENVAAPKNEQVQKEIAGKEQTTNEAISKPQELPVQKAAAAKAAKITDEDEIVVEVPNAFSPDDPSDDVRRFTVIPKQVSNIETFEIFIYSRGGRLVYHSKDINSAWDGTFGGVKQPMGTYVYLIEVRDAVKGLQHTRGTVTLLR